MTEQVKVGNRTYQLGSVLGVGGFSEVCKGVDKETRKRVALKIMYSDKSRSSSELKQQLIQVQKEIKAMKQLSHTNLTRLLGYDLKCEVKGRKAIVMVQQLAPKGELFDYLMYTKKFKEAEANALFKQLIAGLEAMHKAGIAHRDLKPENVLFDNQFNLKLADFGFAYVFQKGESAKTAMRTELGTKGYMAPEIIQNKKYTEKADIFAAGVILFIMLAGFPPFQNAVAKDWWFDKLMKQKYKLFWMAHERTAKFTENAKKILQKMLAPKEADRHDVYSVQKTKFWNGQCLNKDEIVACLKQRKKVVDQEKEKEDEGASRDIFLQILSDKQSELLPDDEPIQLKSVLTNELIGKLGATQDKKNLQLQLVQTCGDHEAAESEMRAAFEQLEDDKAKEVATLLAGSAGLEPNEIVAKLKELDVVVSEQLATFISKALKDTTVGVIDDYALVSKFADLDASANIPKYQVYTAKANAYKTKISFGILAYCLHKFINGKGKMQLNPDKGSIHLIHSIQKKLVLPHEMPNGEVQWKTGKMPVKVVVGVQLSYDEQQKINVVTFENKSDNYMGMKEFAAIVKEITENPLWVLKHFLEGVFTQTDEQLEDTIIPDDFVQEDGDLIEEEEEEVASAE
jgi:serine/threonine protein kinase